MEFCREPEVKGNLMAAAPTGGSGGARGLDADTQTAVRTGDGAQSSPPAPASSLHHGSYGWTHRVTHRLPPGRSEEPQLDNFWASRSPTPCLSFSQELWSINEGQSQAHSAVWTRGVLGGTPCTWAGAGVGEIPLEGGAAILHLARGRRCFPRRCPPLLPLPPGLSLSPQQPSGPPPWGSRAREPESEPWPSGPPQAYPMLVPEIGQGTEAK